MDSREIVKRTLDFSGPERVARSFAPSDFVGGGPRFDHPEGEWRRIDEREWRRTDEWGSVWGRVDEHSKGEIVAGAVGDLGEAATFPMPDFDDPALYAGAKEAFAAAPDKWHVGWIQGFTFSVARKLRRMEQYLVDLLLAPEQIAILHDRVDEQIRVQMNRLKEAGADCVMIAEDWGTQLDLLISPRLWRQQFKPRFVDLCDHAHSLGLAVFMHSCGKITAIVPDLIEAGVDLFQFDQPRIHGLDTLRELQASGRVTYWCPVDIQTTLQTKDKALIRREVDEMLDALWRGEGGFVAGFYEGEAAIGLEPEWQQIACDEFLERGRRDVFG